MIKNLIFILIILLAAFFNTLGVIIAFISFLRNPKGFWYLKPRPNRPQILKTEFTHKFLDLYDGKIRLHYAEAGDPNRPLILFLHGFPEFWYTWRHQLREFENEYHVVALDMRGYGESSKPEAVHEYKITTLVEDVKRTVTALGNGKCILVGHDLGGVVAWTLATRHPELIEKLIILSCMHPKAYENLMKRSFKQTLRSCHMFFFQCPIIPELLFQLRDMEHLEIMLIRPPNGCTNPNAITNEDLEAWKYTFQQPGAIRGPLNYYRAMIRELVFKNGEDDMDGSTLVKPPTLIICGTKDAFFDTALAGDSLQFCENGKLNFIDGASHWVQQDYPELCNQYIKEFLNQ